MLKYETIEKGIREHDVKAIREAIGNICYTSRDFSSGEFDQAIKYVESKGIKLKDDRLNGAPVISKQKNTFTDEDFARAIFELKSNFCDERIEDVKTIGKKLYRKNSVKENPVVSDSYPKQKGRQKNNIIILTAVIITILLLMVFLRMRK